MEKKVVLVTGSSRGLGAATIIEFAKHGYEVVINYNESKEEAFKLKYLVEEEYNSKALVVKADISKEQEVKEMINQIINRFGKIDVLVNNASISIDNSFDRKNVEDFKKILSVNLIGTFIVSKIVSEYMLHQEKGNIINITSTNGIDTNYPESLDYDASKSGIISLTNNFAKQLAPHIRVNAVAPGWIETDMSKDLDYYFKEKELEKIMLNRFADSTEIAKVILFLASDSASYINSTVIRVDGGKN